MRLIACCRAAVLLLLSAVSFFSLAAQEKKISGIIKDEALTLLPAATASVKNSLVSSVPDTAGAFSITVPAVIYAGHQPKELSINNNASLEVIVDPTPSNLNEVIVIGYGNTRKVKLTSVI